MLPAVIPVPVIAETTGFGIPAGIAVGKNILTFPDKVGNDGSQFVQGLVSVIDPKPLAQSVGKVIEQVKDGKEPAWKVMTRSVVGSCEPAILV